MNPEKKAGVRNSYSGFSQVVQRPIKASTSKEKPVLVDAAKSEISSKMSMFDNITPISKQAGLTMPPNKKNEPSWSDIKPLNKSEKFQNKDIRIEELKGK